MVQQETGGKPKAQRTGKLMLVRYGRLGSLGWFEHNENQVPRTGGAVVVQTERGLELGQIVGPCNYRAGQFRNTPEQIEAYFGAVEGRENILAGGGTFVRFASREDIREQEHLEQAAAAESKVCQEFAGEMELPMTIVEAEHLFGGERIIFYFTSEGRVDFRELVKRLAKEYQTRIELRQIGSRDEARLIGDYETCGQQCCCKRFLKILAPVNMRMAKLQKATLDPSKISGHCGRLKCCLRFEDFTYLELRKGLPDKGQIVRTPKGPGKVVDLQVLTQLVVVQTDNGDRHAWPLEDIRPLQDDTAGQEGQPAPAQTAAADNGTTGLQQETAENVAQTQRLPERQTQTPAGNQPGTDQTEKPKEYRGRRRRGQKNRQQTKDKNN